MNFLAYIDETGTKLLNMIKNLDVGGVLNVHIINFSFIVVVEIVVLVKKRMMKRRALGKWVLGYVR